MREEVLEALSVRPGGRYVDGTLGLGGHAEAILRGSAPDGLVLGIDQDPEARRLAADRLTDFGARITIAAGNSRNLPALCRRYGFAEADGVVLDLGVSSLQLDEAARGFSFQQDAPLDMRMDPSAELSATEIVNEWPEEEIAGVIWEYGEERRSRRVARAIVAGRPVETTGALAAIVARAVGGGEKIHPATRTFQALRIAVNDELAALREALIGAVEVLRSPGGRLVVISFHSGEDRIVKEFMRRESSTCLCPPGMPACSCGHEPNLRSVTRRVITPTPVESAANPRSRSAKLRVAERL